jgi:predicted flap endonuclease-1-like 5' DNA nuclease
MGQPMKLERDGETQTVYGPNQAQVMFAQGWQPADESAVIPAAGVDDLTQIGGVGPALASILADAGYRSYTAIAEAPSEHLVALDRVSPKSVKGIQENAAKLAG